MRRQYRRLLLVAGIALGLGLTTAPAQARGGFGSSGHFSHFGLSGHFGRGFVGRSGRPIFFRGDPFFFHRRRAFFADPFFREEPIFFDDPFFVARPRSRFFTHRRRVFFVPEDPFLIRDPFFFGGDRFFRDPFFRLHGR